VLTPSGVMFCESLASCVAVCAYDPVRRVAGIAHVMVPAPVATSGDCGPAADAAGAFDALLEAMRRAGAEGNSIRLALVGGAQVLQRDGDPNPLIDLGWRNAEACLAQSSAHSLPVVGQDFGGSVSRHLRLDAGTGEVVVQTSLRGETALCTLGG
jgi:chemotaxis protein CheD